MLSGGRRFTCVRRWCLWKHYSNYFPLKVSHIELNGSLTEHWGQNWGTGYGHMGKSDSWTCALPSPNCWNPQSFSSSSPFLCLQLSCLHFPLQIVKTKDISPNHNYILACHPHGLMAHSCFGHFATDTTDFPKTFPGITPYMLTLGAFFWVPFLREYIMSTGEWLIGDKAT